MRQTLLALSPRLPALAELVCVQNNDVRHAKKAALLTMRPKFVGLKCDPTPIRYLYAECQLSFQIPSRFCIESNVGPNEDELSTSEGFCATVKAIF